MPVGSSSSSALLQLSRTGRAGSEQQLPSLLVCPQEDEASQADGCHPGDNTCEQAERRRKGSFRGRAESGCCTAGCRSFGKQSQEKFSLAGFFNPTPTEGTCLGCPNTALPSLVAFNPSPHSSGAGGCEPCCGAQTHPHKGLQADGTCPILCCPHPASAEGPPISARSPPTAAARSQQHSTGTSRKAAGMAAHSSARIFRCLILIVLGSEQETHVKPIAQHI